MKLPASIVFLILATFPLFGQFCNEWISESGYDKTYYKFPIVKEGLYRLNAATLEQAGFDMAHYNDIKLYAKGRQVPLYVEPNFIEFVGNRNDGEMDAALFLEPDWQISDHQSLYTDTLFYFLTWDENEDHSRYVHTENDLSAVADPEPFFIHRSTWWAENVFHSGVPFRIGNVNMTYSAFDEGEGFWSPFVDSNAQATNTIVLKTPAVYSGPDAPAPLLQTKIAGRSNEILIFPDHHTKVSVGDELVLDFTFDGHDIAEYESVVSPSALNTLPNSQTQVSYTAASENPDVSDRFSFAYTHLDYARDFDFAGKKGFAFSLDNSSDKYIEISNFDGGVSPVLYDMTNNRRYQPVAENGLYKFQLLAGPDSGEKMDLFFASTDGGFNLAFDLIDTLEPIQFTDYSAIQNQGEYLIIFHPLLTVDTDGVDRIEAYADYRTSDVGGGYSVVTANIEELYDAFSWGVKKHPLAIRNFVNYAIANWTVDPDYLLLIGKSINYKKCRYSPVSYQKNLLPSFGNPASDPLLTTSGNDSYRSQLATGRVSAKSAEQVKIYLDKVVEYEAKEFEDNCDDLTARAFSRRAVHLSGCYNHDDNENGISDDYELFTSILAVYEEAIENDIFRGEVVDSFHYVKPIFSGGVSGSDPGPQGYQAYQDRLAEGVSIINYIGHGTSDFYPTWDFSNSWFLQASNFDPGHYPIIFSGSCFVGDVHVADQISMAEDWTLRPNGGAIGFLGGVQFGFANHLAIYMEALHEQYTDDLYGMSMGTCMKAATEDLYIDLQAINNPTGFSTRKTIEEYTWIGDPAIRLTTYENPEYYFPQADSSIVISGLEPNASEISLAVTVANFGNPAYQPLLIEISIQVPEEAYDEVFLFEVVAAPSDESTYEFDIDISDLPEGSAALTVHLDPNVLLQEDCIDNNLTSALFEHEIWQCPSSTEPLLTQEICSGYSPELPTADLQAAISDEDGLAVGGEDPQISWFRDAAMTEAYDGAALFAEAEDQCANEVFDFYAAISCTTDTALIPVGRLSVTVFAPLTAPTIVRLDDACNYELILACPDAQTLSNEAYFFQLEPEDPAGTLDVIIENALACTGQFTIDYEACPAPPPPLCPTFLGLSATSLQVCEGEFFTLSLEAENAELGEVRWVFPENRIEYGFETEPLLVDPPLGCSAVYPVQVELTCSEPGEVIYSEEIYVEVFAEPVLEAVYDTCFVSLSSKCEDHLITWIDSEGNAGSGDSYEFEPGCEVDVTFSAENASTQPDCGTAELTVECDCELSTAIEDQDLEKQLKISPNPNSGHFVIRVPAHNSSADIRLEVFDALGRSLEFNYQQVEVDLQVQLPSSSHGLFFLQVIDGASNTRMTEKILVR